MSNKKYAVILCILIILISVSLSACFPNATQPCEILLTNGHIARYTLGEFNLASIGNDSYSRQFEILAQDIQDFIEFLKSSEYYIGNFAVMPNCYYIGKTNRCKQIKGGDECMWFANQGYVWIGKFYADKYFYLAHFPQIILNDDKCFVYLSESIFACEKMPTSIDEEYDCALTWEQLKKVFNNNTIDNEHHTIEIEHQTFNNSEHGTDSLCYKTVLCFNIDNNTMKISVNQH